MAKAYQAWTSLNIAESYGRGTGGEEGFKHRIRMFLLFEKMREVVVGPVVIGPEKVQAVYDADVAYHAVSLAEATPVILDRLAKEEVERRWAEWLRAQRSCANIMVLDSSFVLPSTTPRPDCREDLG